MKKRWHYILLLIALGFGSGAWYWRRESRKVSDEIHRVKTTPIVRAEVDISASGKYRVTGDLNVLPESPKPWKAWVLLEIVPPPSSGQEAEKISQGLSGSYHITDSDGEYLFPEKKGLHCSKEAILRGKKIHHDHDSLPPQHKQYTIEVNVIQNSPGLEKRKLIITCYNRYCGMESAKVIELFGPFLAYFCPASIFFFIFLGIHIKKFCAALEKRPKQNPTT